MQEQKISSNDVNKLLVQNEALIRKIIQESNMRKNKNLVNYNVTSMLNDLERNIITICREQPPEVLADHKVMKSQSEVFQKMMKKRTSTPPLRPPQNK